MATLDISRLTPKERLDLIGQLWDSLSPSDVQLTQAQEAELDRRLASFDEDARSAIAWEKSTPTWAAGSDECPAYSLRPRRGLTSLTLFAGTTPMPPRSCRTFETPCGQRSRGLARAPGSSHPRRRGHHDPLEGSKQRGPDERRRHPGLPSTDPGSCALPHLRFSRSVVSS